MMKPVSVLLIVLMVFCGLSLSAQEAEQMEVSVFDAWPSALGYHTTNTVGAGLSWQRWYGKTGFAVTAGVEYLPSMESYAELDYHLQLHAARMIHAFRFSNRISGNLHALVTGAYRAMKLNDYDPVLEMPVQGPLRHDFFIGLGLGLEYVLFGHLSHGYDFMYIGNLSDLTVGVNVGTSLRFRF